MLTMGVDKMISSTIKVVSGLESRPAALFVQMAGKFQSRITVSIDDKSVNAKSIMGVISLGIQDGQMVSITADGQDENEAITELAGFLSEERSD